MHADQKHPKNTFEECFPSPAEEESKDEYAGYGDYDQVEEEPKVTV
jgi:hypothetical protein